jgi:hypothetical protein
MISDDWQPWFAWFAWYPVRVSTYHRVRGWRQTRWVWLRRVEWTEGHMDGDWLYRYRLPADERGRDG